MGFVIIYIIVCTDVKTGNKYKVAEFYKMNNTFYFKYILENVKEAQKSGFKLLIAFHQSMLYMITQNYLLLLRQDYWSPQCRNKANVYKSRAKNKE